ncbi:hypothetical protein E3N88_33164 [Mikania micrantha]|uniref:Uncharacterized protein n=1 Tax=Mikania micrantha TaxID=192012 RepID=A0A5N6MAL6_9ASTR|nr:hypothetical protein E3N88_33164 [Mikania micrantha]
MAEMTSGGDSLMCNATKKDRRRGLPVAGKPRRRSYGFCGASSRRRLRYWVVGGGNGLSAARSTVRRLLTLHDG